MVKTPRKPFPRSVPGEPARPLLLEFLALHCGIGAAMGIGLAGLVLLSNLGGIRDLLKASSEPYVPMILFFASFALTFASVKMGMAVMSLPLEAPDAEDDDRAAASPADDPSDGPNAGEPTGTGDKPAADNRLLGRRE